MKRPRLISAATAWLPPLVAPRVAAICYPPARALADDAEVEVRSCTGARYRCRTSTVYGGLTMTLLGYHEWRSLIIAAEVCRPGDTVVEVGAHIGTETVGFADLVGPEGTVHAFEPLPANADLIRANLDRNGFDHVTLHRAAVSDAAGTATFVVPECAANTAGGHLGGGDPRDEVVEVPVVTLDGALPATRGVRLLSVDAEGADTGVLLGARGLLQAARPVVIVEANRPEDDRLGRWTLDDLAGALRGHGYGLWRVERVGLSPVPADATGSALLPRRPGYVNWLGLPTEEADLARRVDPVLRRAALLPCVPGVNPLRRRRPPTRR